MSGIQLLKIFFEAVPIYKGTEKFPQGARSYSYRCLSGTDINAKMPALVFTGAGWG